MEREQSTIRIPFEMYREIHQKANESKLSVNALIMTIINNYINQNQ